MLRCSLELSEALLITHQISTAKREGCSCVCSFSTLLFFEYLNILQLKASKMTEEKSHKGSSKGQKTWHVGFYEKEE